ncbi:MAG: hypothetical protein IKM88_04520 [Lachnospiraceae bacterium]|nr:hypothetical protein [Lachnospiraceae bacterium]MBR6849483.1 hypothetical protein [Lachnospiraceae bacterium]
MKKKILFATVLLAFGMSACGKTTTDPKISDTTPAPTTVSAEPTQAESIQVDTEAVATETVPEETEEHVRTPEQEHIAELLYTEVPKTAAAAYMTIIYDGVEYPVKGHGFWDEENDFLYLNYLGQSEGDQRLGYVKYGDKEYFGLMDFVYNPSEDPYEYDTITDFKTGDVIEFSFNYDGKGQVQYRIDGNEYTASDKDVNAIHILEEKGIEVIYDRDKLLEEPVQPAAAVAAPAN